jgi:hypothetical protein
MAEHGSDGRGSIPQIAYDLGLSGFNSADILPPLGLDLCFTLFTNKKREPKKGSPKR